MVSAGAGGVGRWVGVGRSGQVKSGFRKAVTFDVVRRALKDEYILRTWRRWHASGKSIQRQGGIHVQGLYGQAQGL